MQVFRTLIYFIFAIFLYIGRLIVIIMSCKAKATSVTIEFKIGFLIVYIWHCDGMKLGSGVVMCMNECAWVGGESIKLSNVNAIFCCWQTKTHTHAHITVSHSSCYGNVVLTELCGKIIYVSLVVIHNSHSWHQNAQPTKRMLVCVRRPEIKFEIGLLLVWSDNKYIWDYWNISFMQLSLRNMLE